MDTYFFLFDAEPSDHSPRAADIAGARVLVFVHCAEAEQAETIARSSVIDYGWRITSVQEARGPMPADIPGMDGGLVALRKKAERFGVASEFYAWPKVERPEDSPWEVRRMGLPLLNSNKKQ